MTKDWRCKKFKFGLRQELKEVVVPLSIREFPALVEKAKVVDIKFYYIKIKVILYLIKFYFILSIKSGLIKMKNELKM